MYRYILNDLTYVGYYGDDVTRDYLIENKIVSAENLAIYETFADRDGIISAYFSSRFVIVVALV